MQTKLKVNLISYTPDPEKIIAGAARLCYSEQGIDDIMDAMTPEESGRMVDMLMEMGHESPIEHVSFTFGIEGVSRSLLAQLTRHRIASYSVKSQRYVQEGQFQYIIPPEIDAIPQAREVFIQAMEEHQRRYNQLVGILLGKYASKYFLENLFTLPLGGLSFADALKRSFPNEYAKCEKKAIEDARFVLPNACETKLMVTMNARSLINFFHHRCCRRAQWEIRALAIEMLRLVKEVAPTLFKDAGPRCLTGPCPEGKMSCGDIAEVREEFKGGTNNEYS